MIDKYILDGHNPVPCDDPVEWATWLQAADRTVAKTETPDGTIVSTVFLGLDHRLIDNGKPLLFETLIFGGHLDGEQWRCSTWEEAEAQHESAVMAAQKEEGK